LALLFLTALVTAAFVPFAVTLTPLGTYLNPIASTPKLPSYANGPHSAIFYCPTFGFQLPCVQATTWLEGDKAGPTCSSNAFSFNRYSLAFSLVLYYPVVA